jgi:hypothetical protein
MTRVNGLENRFKAASIRYRDVKGKEATKNTNLTKGHDGLAAA